ncbi:hypothetical protein, partial [Stenotrophomonas sp. HMWF023]|uniref:hypothetical protein n=1 Tax=Stenotrophomonas sp. HMWF023 TaxID=2056859 RepID=UPI000D33E99E
SFYITGDMREGDHVPIGQAFADYFGGTIPGVPANMNVTTLSFTADPIGQVYQGQSIVIFGTPDDPQPDQAWTIMSIGTVGISVQQLEMWVEARQGHVGGGISGVFFLKGAGHTSGEDPRLTLLAERPVQGDDAPQGWLFAAHLFPGTSIDLTQMVARFIMGDPDYVVPGYVPTIAIDALDATFATGPGAYTFKGTASARWTPKLFGTELMVNASASTDIARAGTNAPVTGTLSGSFAINKFAIQVAMDIGVAEPTYLFKVLYGERWIQATTSWRGKPDARHQVVALQLGGITLGEILEDLVNLAAPTLGFTLDPPWDLLKRVDLSRFVLTLDPQENVVEFTFDAQVNLGVMRVDTIGARYRRGTGQGKVELILTGNFLGQGYSANDPLSWDVVNGAPPSVAGQGPKTVDLRFIGFGQRITFAGETPDTVAKSVTQLRNAMKKPEPGKNPVGNGLVYAADSQWLMGLDIGLMGMIDLGIIFDDPRLYGLSVSLGGERAGSLAGLRFEILYKKITNDIGMYRIELRVPDAFRTIQLGAVSLTLGIVVIEVYTNGNFKIDLGFPYNRDYSRSFSLQAGIIIGRGGFYFGILNGDTSTSVPKISNGNFSPVIELGVGLAAGVGREINVGVLSGGAYIQVEVIFQGVLAWFNPTASGARSAMYFRAQGVVALHGKVYGKVDFVVISASVTLEAFAQAMVVFESYRPILLEFTVGVRAEASVKILFIRINFHFSVTLQLGFTIGSASPTPWILSGSDSTSSPRLGSAGRSQVWLSAPRHAQRTAALRHGYVTRLRRSRMALGTLLADDGYVLQWKPHTLVFDAKQTAPLTMLPCITVGDVPVDWAGATPDNTAPRYRAAFLLYADTGMDPTQKTAAGMVRRNVVLSGGKTLAADLLVSGLLRYALYALPDGPTSTTDPINAAQVALLLEQLALPQTASAGFSMDGLDTFFSTNLSFVIGGVPVTAANDELPERSAMIFPMPPGLTWQSPQAGDRDFSTYNAMGGAYESGVAAILGAYFPEGGSARDAADDPAAYASFATYLFRDFCQMLVKAAVTEAQKQFVDVKVPVTASMSLADAARTFDTAAVPCVKEVGDNVQSVAARTGATSEELLFLNPGLQATIDATQVGAALDPEPLIGVSPGMLVQDNPGIALVASAWPLGNVNRAVGAPSTTLDNLAGLFNVASVASLFAYVPPPGDGYMLGVDPNLLSEGRDLALATQVFTPPADGGFDRARTAAAFFVRYADPDLSASTLPDAPDMPAWYAQAIAILNPALSAAHAAGDSVEIDPGVSLRVPRIYGDRTATQAYITLPGDTLHRIGSTLVLCQDAAALASPPSLWPAFAAGVVADGSSFTLPAWPLDGKGPGIVVEAGETVERLARRLAVNVGYNAASGWTYDWTAISVWLGPAAILAPMAVVTLPGASISGAAAYTFQQLSDTYGLTLTDLAVRLGTQKGLLPDAATLTVRQLPTLSVQDVEDGVLSTGSFAGVVNQASQMLMSGLRLPALKTVSVDVDGTTVQAVVPAPSRPTPLYDLTGQQFDLAVNADPDHANDVALTMTVTSSVPWLQFGSTFTVGEGHDTATLNEQHPALLADNLLLHAATALPPGMVLFSSVGDDSLDFSFTNAQILHDAPATGLALTTLPAAPPAPQALPLMGTSPTTYGIENPVTLQSPQTLPIPVEGTALAGYASLWPFPQGLLKRAEEGATTPYAIFAGNQPGATLENARPLASTTFGCQLSFRIRRMDDGSRRFLLLGVDTDQRAWLLMLRNAILAGGADDATKGYLAVTPAPNASNAQGISLFDATQPCFLIKTNLSTDSQPQAQLMRAAALGEIDAPVYYADFATSLADFLLLLWEGSVVGGTGYYIGFGKDLPGSAFDGQGLATLNLLVIAGDQQALAPGGRTLRPFNNCLLVAPGLDASIHSLYAEASDASDLAEVPLTPPGTAGFMLTITTPTGDSPEAALQDRYNTLVYWCADSSSPYAIAPAWTPALPKPSDGQSLQAWERQRLAREARLRGTDADPLPEPYWRYEQVVPFHRFTTTLATVSVPGLPPEANNPYRGFGDASACPTPQLTFCLSDLLGNHSLEPSVTGQGSTTLTVGYNDALIALSQWPEATTFFEVLGSSGAATLAMSLSLKAAAAQPGPSQRGDGAVEQARQQNAQYANIYYQLAQQGITAALSTSLHHVPGNDALPIAVAPLWRYAAGAYAYSATAMQLAAQGADGITLADVLDTWPVRCAEIAVANADVPLEQLFAPGSSVSVPAFMPFVAQRSLADLYAQRPAGWPDPGSAAALYAAPGNASLPLAVGASLQLPATVTYPTGSNAATPSLAQIAQAHCADVGRLGELNAAAAVFAPMNGVQDDQPNILIATFVQEDGTPLVLHVTVEAGKTDSFDAARAAFATQGANLTVADIAAANAERSGLLLPDKQLSNDTYVARSGDTVGSNGSGATVTAMATANAATAGIFDDGALVLFGVETLPLPADTLEMVAQRYACPADLLLSSNTPLTCGALFAIPGVSAWPTDDTVRAALRLPYTVSPGDLLATICMHFAGDSSTDTTTPSACMAANLTTPGTVAKDITLAIVVPGGNVSITTPAVQSFNATLLQAQAINPATTLDQLADAMAGLADALEPGALMMMPPARLPTTTAAGSVMPLYGVDAAAFALANAATPGLIVDGVVLSLPHPEQSGVKVEVTTRVNDTFNSVAVRFSLKGVATDAGAIAVGNPDALLYAEHALALLPPCAMRATVALGAGGPYPDTVFPLTASLTLARPAVLIHPDFSADGPVAVATSALAPHAQGKSADGSLNFGSFIESLTTAIADVRVGTAKVAGETADLWCVDFSATGIDEVALKSGVTFPGQAPMPRFLALAPLYDHLVTRQTDICALNEDGALAETGVPTHFMAIDAEPWAHRFLADMDRFLGGTIATWLYSTPDLLPALTETLQSKGVLAEAIAEQLQAVFNYDGYATPPDPGYVNGLAVACSALTQQLDVSLLRAYDTSVVVQYDTTSRTPWTTGNAPVSLYGQGRLVPDADGRDAAAVTFAASKTGFDPDAAFVGFFATVADPDRHSWIRGTLEYAYSHTEFGITDGGVPAGYLASNWLSFMPAQDAGAKPKALEGTDPGKLLAPIPLRTYPALPSIRDQSAGPTYLVPDSLAQLPLWTYRLTCSHPFAAQDGVLITTEFNLTPPAQRFARVDTPDLFANLAQYIAVADGIWTLIDDLDGKADLAARTNAALTFAVLAGRIAGTWSVRTPQARAGGAGLDAIATATFAFNARVAYTIEPETQTSLVSSVSLTREQAQPGPGGTWPSLEVMLPDGRAVTLHANASTDAGAASSDTRVYVPEAGTSVPAFDTQTLRLSWNDINVSAYQNARARMLAVRNQNLLYDPVRPENPILATSEAFLLKTAEVTATNVVTPLIERGMPQVIAGSTVGAALAAAIDTLFPPAG